MQSLYIFTWKSQQPIESINQFEAICLTILGNGFFFKMLPWKTSRIQKPGEWTNECCHDAAHDAKEVRYVLEIKIFPCPENPLKTRFQMEITDVNLVRLDDEGDKEGELDALLMPELPRAAELFRELLVAFAVEPGDPAPETELLAFKMEPVLVLRPNLVCNSLLRNSIGFCSSFFINSISSFRSLSESWTCKKGFHLQ